MNHYIILILLIAAFALGGVGCDDGRAHGSRRPLKGNPSGTTSRARPEPRKVKSEAKPVTSPAQVEKHAQEAESTAADLGQAITTLGEVCTVAQETRRALLTAKYDGNDKAGPEVKEGNSHGNE